jgi:DUF4097 and DUF4098 domain-containing protein YvlB
MRSVFLSFAVLAASAAVSLAQVSEPYSRTVPLTADGVFSIENVNGAVSVETWDRNEVEIQAVRKARDAATLERVKIEVKAETARVAVSTEMERGTNGASVDYRIRAPRHAHLVLEVVNGALRVLEPAGPVEASSVNGSVEIGDAAGPVKAESVNGAVEVGYVTLAAGAHDFEAVNGRVTVRMPDSVSGKFHAKTVNGGIQTDFPLEVHKPKYGPGRSLSGTLGEGRADVHLETVNGAIEVRRGGESVASRIREKLAEPTQ